jgi:hypothetical protein
MTAAQKKARENFTKAIAYRKKTGCSLKEAFAKVKVGKVGSSKKDHTALDILNYRSKIGDKKFKKLTPKQRVANATKKTAKKRTRKIGALPIGFSGNIWGVKFKIINQFDIYNQVASIMEDSINGSTIVVFDGKADANKLGQNILNYVSYNGDKEYKKIADQNYLKSKMIMFAKRMQKEVKDYNSGKKNTIKKLPLNIAKPKSKPEKKAVTKTIKKHSVSKHKTLHYAGRTRGEDGKRAYKYVLSGVKKIGDIFDTKVISDLDSLKKEYFKLAKKYHPDAGGTTQQFQQLQAEYEKLLKKILSGSSLNTEQKQNEVEIDQAIRDIIDALVNVQNIDVEIVGKWLWVGGNTYPVRTILKGAGLTFIKKAGVPYWVYKGTESKGRGNMSIEEIKAKYGSHKIETPKTKSINGFRLTPTQKSKLKKGLSKLTKGLNKRPI